MGTGGGTYLRIEWGSEGVRECVRHAAHLKNLSYQPSLMIQYVFRLRDLRIELSLKSSARWIIFSLLGHTFNLVYEYHWHVSNIKSGLIEPIFTHIPIHVLFLCGRETTNRNREISFGMYLSVYLYTSAP